MLLGEVRLAAAGVGRTGAAEALPQAVVGRLVEAGQRLPLVEQVAQPVGTAAPVVALGKPLGLGDDLVLLDLGLGGTLRLLDPLGLPLDRDHRCGRVEASGQAGEVTDGVGRGDLLTETLHRGGCLLGGQLPGVDPLLEEVHLEGERVEAIGVELQRLLGAPLGVLPHGAFPIRGLDVDGAVLGHPAPVGLLVGAHGRPS